MSDEWRKMQLETRVKKWFCVSYISKRNGKRIVRNYPERFWIVWEVEKWEWKKKFVKSLISKISYQSESKKLEKFKQRIAVLPFYFLVINS